MSDINKNKVINIYSMLNCDVAGSFSYAISDDCCINLTSSTDYFDAEDIGSISFWKKISKINPDAVLLPLSSTDIRELKSVSEDNSNMFDANRPWQYINAAVIAVLTGDNIHDAVIAAQLDFDGILTEPFIGGHLQNIISGAIERKTQKSLLNARYHRLQRVIKAINQNRHILQSKVDLLCNDLVQSNKDIAGKMKEMSKAYDFQKSLTGEFDLKYMLHKALKHISHNHPNTNAAIYLCDTDKIEVMLMDSWFDGEISPQQLESCLKNSIIPATIAKNETVIVNNAGDNNAFPTICCTNLNGLSICGIPIRHSVHNEGILVLYRSETVPFTQEELEQLDPIITPMSRSIEALLNLQDMLEMA